MTPDLQSTLDAIDAATGCQQCAGPLGASPSGDFCTEFCQQRWSARRVGAEVSPPSRPLDAYFAYVLARYAYVRPPSVRDFIRITGV